MRRRALVSLTVGILSVSAVAAGGASAWVRVETPSFVVFGEIGEKRTREVAMEFERFREALVRILPRATSPVARPLSDRCRMRCSAASIQDARYRSTCGD
jgi:hypothetical protein